MRDNIIVKKIMFSNLSFCNVEALSSCERSGLFYPFKTSRVRSSTKNSTSTNFPTSGTGVYFEIFNKN